MSPILGIIASSQQSQFLGNFDSIATVTVGSGGSTSITFDNIAGTYKHLQIRYIGRARDGYNSIALRFNNDTSSVYSWHRLYGNGSTASADAGATQDKILAGRIAQTTDSANIFGAGIIDILDYANTNKYKTIRNLDGSDANGSGEMFLHSGSWQKTNAITRIDIIDWQTPMAFAQYSTFALYGIKGA
jgi:hypothetical protein